MRTIKIQLPYISWLFILLDILLLGYQFIRVFLHPEERRRWPNAVLLLLLMAYNCVAGGLLTIWVQISTNVPVLLLIVILLWRKQSVPAVKGPEELPGAPFQPVEAIEGVTLLFAENCRKYQLSPREIDVVLLLARGMTYKEIAETLHIAVSTVDSHTQKCYKKAGATNKVALLIKLGQ